MSFRWRLEIDTGATWNVDVHLFSWYLWGFEVTSLGVKLSFSWNANRFVKKVNSVHKVDLNLNRFCQFTKIEILIGHVWRQILLKKKNIKLFDWQQHYSKQSNRDDSSWNEIIHSFGVLNFFPNCTEFISLYKCMVSVQYLIVLEGTI